MGVRCIRCGKETNYEQVSPCPDCGYKMFPLPYDREDTLRREIRGYLRTLLCPPLSSEEIRCYRTVPSKQKSEQEQIILKEEDDQRFPDLEKLRGYVCGASRTEVFRERLDESIAELRKHLRTPYQREYQVDLASYQEKVQIYNQDLESALRILSLPAEVNPYTPPKALLYYEEMPDEQLTKIADSLLVTLESLSVKIEKFIRQNNIYGTGYQSRTKICYRCASGKDADTVAILSALSENLSKILKKSYTVDLLSDGSQELGEMLTVLWNTFAALM